MTQEEYHNLMCLMADRLGRIALATEKIANSSHAIHMWMGDLAKLHRATASNICTEIDRIGNAILEELRKPKAMAKDESVPAKPKPIDYGILSAPILKEKKKRKP